MTNPIIQYSAYTQYAFDMKLITKEDQDNINKLLRPCEDATNICGTRSLLDSYYRLFTITVNRGYSVVEFEEIVLLYAI